MRDKEGLETVLLLNDQEIIFCKMCSLFWLYDDFNDHMNVKIRVPS